MAPLTARRDDFSSTCHPWLSLNQRLFCDTTLSGHHHTRGRHGVSRRLFSLTSTHRAPLFDGRLCSFSYTCINMYSTGACSPSPSVTHLIVPFRPSSLDRGLGRFVVMEHHRSLYPCNITDPHSAPPAIYTRIGGLACI